MEEDSWFSDQETTWERSRHEQTTMSPRMHQPAALLVLCYAAVLCSALDLSSVLSAASELQQNGTTNQDVAALPGVAAAPGPGVTAPDFPGVAAPNLTGVVAPVLPGVAAPVLPGVAAPVLPGVAAPVLPGVAAPDSPGIAAPVLPGVALPVLPGVAAPVLPGVGVPVLPGVAAPVLPGVAAPDLPGVAAADSSPYGATDLVVGAVNVPVLPPGAFLPPGSSGGLPEAPVNQTFNFSSNLPGAGDGSGGAPSFPGAINFPGVGNVPGPVADGEGSKVKCDDFCALFPSLCKEDEICVTEATTCSMKCLKGNGSNVTSVPQNDEPLPQVSQVTCSKSGSVCIYGSCPDGETCQCDIGYEGDLCDIKQCYVPCVHGICYMTSPTSSQCACEPGWGGVMCHEPACTLPCVHGSCMWHEETTDYSNYSAADAHSTMFCSCDHKHVGKLCDKLKPKASRGNDAPQNVESSAVGVAIFLGLRLILTKVFFYFDV